jgi:niacin transporter
MAVLSSARLRRIVLSAMMTALAVALPPVFHLIGLGSKFLPLLVPLLLAGFVLPWRWAVITGAASPWISALATGMPPVWPPIAVSLSLEGAVMGGTAAVLYGDGRRRRLRTAMIGAILAGRVTGFAATYLMARLFELPAAFASLAAVIQGLPGVALMMVTVPLAVRWAEHRDSPLLAKEDTP